MKAKHKKYLDSGMTNLLVLLLFVYAFIACVACYKVLSDDIDFGVVANNQTEAVWRVSD